MNEKYDSNKDLFREMLTKGRSVKVKDVFTMRLMSKVEALEEKKSKESSFNNSWIFMLIAVILAFALVGLLSFFQYDAWELSIHSEGLGQTIVWFSLFFLVGFILFQINAFLSHQMKGFN